MSTVTVTATAQQRVASSPSPAPSAPPSSGPKQTLLLIDGLWYDVTAWKGQHPGGPKILEQISGSDCTDAFYSLHGEDAIARLKRMRGVATLPPALASCPPAAPTKAALAFRQFRAELAAQGWFKRSLAWEAFYTLSVYGLLALGTYFCFTGHPYLAILCIALGMQQSGWISHDYIHARNNYCYVNGNIMGSLTNAFSRAWWSNKHNTHHVFTNYIGVDADIQNDPVFHLFFPNEEDDVIFRKLQHWYFVPVASVLYLSWRVQSLQYALQHRLYTELCFMAVNYLWLYQLGWFVSLLSIYFGGMFVAVIVTATHQSEEMIDGHNVDSADSDSAAAGAHTEASTYSFCEGQFATTRDARTSDPLTEWFWGGMQYQLEHHLFPTMPKYHYARVAPLVEAFAKKNGLSYRVDSQIEIWKRNFDTLKHYAQKVAPDSKTK